jgi:hypothetical protein
MLILLQDMIMQIVEKCLDRVIARKHIPLSSRSEIS